MLKKRRELWSVNIEKGFSNPVKLLNVIVLGTGNTVKQHKIIG